MFFKSSPPLGLDGEQYRVQLGLHPVIALLGLRRANMEENGQAGDLQSSYRNSDCQFSNVSRII